MVNRLRTFWKKNRDYRKLYRAGQAAFKTHQPFNVNEPLALREGWLAEQRKENRWLYREGWNAYWAYIPLTNQKQAFRDGWSAAQAEETRQKEAQERAFYESMGRDW